MAWNKDWVEEQRDVGMPLKGRRRRSPPPPGKKMLLGIYGGEKFKGLDRSTAAVVGSENPARNRRKTIHS